MQLQDLEIYVQLYEQHSINRVAKLMGFAQSNITARLHAIETEFDVELFTRSYQGITPTKNGKQFYQYAQSVLNATRKIRAQMRPSTVSKRRIVMSQLLFNLLVVKQKQYSLAQNTFDLLSSTEILALSDNEVDIVVTYANFNNSDYQEIATDYLPASFVVASGLEEDGQLPYLVNSDRHCPFRARTLRRLNHDMTNIQEIDSWDSIIKLVKNGLGIALLPDYLTASDEFKRIDSKHRFKVPYATFTKVSQ
ncbi:LysR family transcriptional regulator [Furfurilactobacillus milii]|nr:LysR family transcriptional regulator [Furfurilactobacillus milii]